MNAKQSALDAYLACTAAIHAKLQRLQHLADDHFGHDADLSIGATSATSGGWRPGWTSCWQSSAATSDDAHQPSESVLHAPEMIQAVRDEAQKLDATVSEPTVVRAMRNLSAVWNEMFPEERCRLVRLLIARIQLKTEGIDFEWYPAGWLALMSTLAPNSIGAELRELEMEAMV